MALAPMSLAGTAAEAETATGSMALAPLALAGSDTETETVAGSMALAPMALSGSVTETETATGSMALAPMALNGSAFVPTTTSGSLALEPMAMSGTDLNSWRLMDGLAGRPGNGPGVSTYSGNFIAGILWEVTENGLWFEGYWHWVPTGGDTTARKFALWQLSDTTHSVSQTLVPGSVVTSGTLTVNQWNYVPLATPINLSGSVPYLAAYGYVATNGFPDTQNQFGSGEPYSAGITNGPLFAYSSQSGSAKEPFTSNYPQGVFSVAGSDPSTTCPTTQDADSNFWIDVQVTSTPPAGASYRIWPSQPYAINYVDDTADNFTLATEFSTSGDCVLDKIWFYSASGYTQLPTECGIWDVSGGTLVSGTDNASPSWSGAAGSGWVSVDYSGTTVVLPAGDYKVAVVNSAGTPAIWNTTTNNYWGSGVGVGGVTNGPISAPDTTHATSPGQDTYNLGATFTYPLTYSAPANGANYWVDVEVTPGDGSVTATGSLALAPMALSGTVGQAESGTGSLALAPMALNGSVSETETSSGSVALAPMAFAASGTVIASGSAVGSIALAPMALAGAVGQTITSAGSIALAPMAMSGAQPGPISMTGSAALAPLALAGSVTETETASGSIALAPLAIQGQPPAGVTSAGSIALAQMALHAGQFPPVPGEASGQFTILRYEGTFSVLDRKGSVENEARADGHMD